MDENSGGEAIGLDRQKKPAAQVFVTPGWLVFRYSGKPLNVACNLFHTLGLGRAQLLERIFPRCRQERKREWLSKDFAECIDRSW